MQKSPENLEKPYSNPVQGLLYTAVERKKKMPFPIQMKK
jgi:hypothetical protein